jgi:hypothetical protein
MRRFFCDDFDSAEGYTAPERISDVSQVPVDSLGKCDVWSFGCILFQLYDGRTLFWDREEVKKFAELKRDPEVPSSTESQGRDTLSKWIQSMLRIDYDRRPTARQLGQRFYELLAIVTQAADEASITSPDGFLDSKYSLSTDIPPNSSAQGTFESLRREDLFPISSPKYRQRRLRRAEQILNAREALLGIDHPLTIWSMTVLAWIYYFEGPLRKGVTLFEDLVRFTTETRGVEHRETLAAMAGLAWTMALDPRNPDAAQPLFRKVRTLQEKVLGAKHPDTMNTNAALGREFLLDAHKILLGAVNLEKVCLSSKFTEHQKQEMVGKRQQGRRRVQEGFDLLSQTHRDQCVVIGLAHRDTAETLSYLAWAYLLKVDMKHAAQLQSEVFAIQKEVLGMGSPETLYTLSEWGWRLIELGRPEGIQKLEEAFERQTIVLGKSHSQTCSSMEGLIWAYDLYGPKTKADRLKRLRNS